LFVSIIYLLLSLFVSFILFHILFSFLPLIFFYFLRLTSSFSFYDLFVSENCLIIHIQLHRVLVYIHTSSASNYSTVVHTVNNWALFRQLYKTSR
jgi:hypothetical protein